MKKLEPGMLCRITGSAVKQNEGRLVTLVRFVEEPPISPITRSWKGSDWWETDTPILTTIGEFTPHARACKLDPINPDHEPADADWQAGFKRLLSGDKQQVKQG